jgi:hypothetical protein
MICDNILVAKRGMERQMFDHIITFYTLKAQRDLNPFSKLKALDEAGYYRRLSYAGGCR